MTIEELCSIRISKPDPGIRDEAKKRWDAIAKPIDGLGRMEEIICRIASARGELCPDISKKALVIMCADNGVVREGVSQTDQSVTGQVARLMGERKSSVGIMIRGYGADIFTIDVGINSDEKYPGVIDRKVRKGTADIALGPAMTERECLKAIEAGIGTVRDCSEKGYGLIAAGEMGIGNTTTGTALLCALTGMDPALLTGPGAGLPESSLKRKEQVIRNALELHLREIGENGTLSPQGENTAEGFDSPQSVFECLRRLGGLDIAGMTGVFIGGAMYRIPVVIDGLICAAAALTAQRIVNGCREYMIASHTGREKGTDVALDLLQLSPVICADLSLGEGTGAVMLFPLLDMAMALYAEGSSFSETGIRKYERYQG